MNRLQVRRLGLQPYQPVWQAMQHYTQHRAATSADEIWLLQHTPVFTQGLNGKPEHILNAGNIPVIDIDRGGQVTYHGPGQLIAYCLLDLKRNNFGVRQVVTAMETAVMCLLERYGIESHVRKDAPGVYIDESKVSALGLRVKKGCSYHGLSLNIDMDMTPFSQINPCGFKDLSVTQLVDYGVTDTIEEIEEKLLFELKKQLGFEQHDETRDALEELIEK